MVTLAGNKLRLNAAFAEVANLNRYEFVGLYDASTKQLALKFYMSQTDAFPDNGIDEDVMCDWPPLPPNVMPMQRDGGRKGADVKGRVVSCGQIIPHNVILRNAQQSTNKAARQFLPMYDDDSKSWLLKPVFHDDSLLPF